ncbi:MAG: hypothetical protein HC871_12365, partial [Rhizobiales bacterium]|nr:hypothetical protein [Hyphomicrobiales bacterium]
MADLEVLRSGHGFETRRRHAAVLLGGRVVGGRRDGPAASHIRPAARSCQPPHDLPRHAAGSLHLPWCVWPWCARRSASPTVTCSLLTLAGACAPVNREVTGFARMILLPAQDQLDAQRHQGAAADAPRLIDLVWGDASKPKVTLVGKGVCFDSGGLDLKTADGMLRMKDDMSGAAAVLGIFQALPRLKPPVEVH